MEETKENKQNNQKPAKDHTLFMVILVGILVIALGCCIIYSMNLRKELITEQQRKMENTNTPQIASQEEIKNNEIVENNEVTTNVATKTVKKVKVERQELTKDTGEYRFIFYGKDSKNKTIWTYKTVKTQPTELEGIEHLKTTTDRVYINELGTIVALNKETGKVIWKNKDYEGAGSDFVFDDEETLYISGYYGPDLCVINKKGKTIKKISSFNEDKYMWPGNLKLNANNQLEISVTKVTEKNNDDPDLMEEAILVVNLKDYSVKEK